ncbi:MAG: depupylase/deamidase Dop [Actinomycetota bacterium]|nr:depupylase/deamidase Dop [Actinomycetota bacterium]
MAIEKILGIETEYGVAGGPDYDPTTASSIIVNAYAQQGRTRISWDFNDESPGTDARGVLGVGALAPTIETHLANTVLTNAARLYVDHAHPEYSSPECASPAQATLYDQAGEEVMRRAQRAANETLPEELKIKLYKNNSDGKGNSYGTHENYLVARQVEFADVVRAMVPHFVSRQVIVGAGKVGSETDGARGFDHDFQLSARAEFFEEVVGLETTLKRPIINTRDEPHSDAERFRRLHVICGDANMSPVATFVKLGSTALLLAALEDDGPSRFPSPPALPVRAIREFSLDTTLRHAVADEEGRTRSAWDYQDELWHLAQRYVERHGGDAVAKADEVREILNQWRELLDGVRDEPDAVADRVDWVAKRRIVEGYRSRYDLGPYDAKLRAIDLQYHDVSRDKSLAQRVGLREIFSDEQIRHAVVHAPEDTRAYFRGQCVTRFPDDIVSANWDSIVFDVGHGPLQRIPMMDPARGTRALTGSLFEQNSTAVALVAALNG